MWDFDPIRLGAAVSMEISTPDPDFKTFYLVLP